MHDALAPGRTIGSRHIASMVTHLTLIGALMVTTMIAASEGQLVVETCPGALAAGKEAGQRL